VIAKAAVIIAVAIAPTFRASVAPVSAAAARTVAVIGIAIVRIAIVVIWIVVIIRPVIEIETGPAVMAIISMAVMMAIISMAAMMAIVAMAVVMPFLRQDETGGRRLAGFQVSR
jgi:hypothetical protein